MVEIEIGVLRGQCLDRRIGERQALVAEIAAWEHQRNAAGARVKWMFTTERARAKLARAYPHTAKDNPCAELSASNWRSTVDGGSGRASTALIA